MYDKKVVCDKYLNRGIPLVRLDEKFIFFTQIINDLENIKPYYDIKSIRINLRPLIRAIIEHAVEWRNTLGNMFSDRTSIDMVNMNAEFKVNDDLLPEGRCYLTVRSALWEILFWEKIRELSFGRNQRWLFF